MIENWVLFRFVPSAHRILKSKLMLPKPFIFFIYFFFPPNSLKYKKLDLRQMFLSPSKFIEGKKKKTEFLFLSQVNAQQNDREGPWEHVA